MACLSQQLKNDEKQSAHYWGYRMKLVKSKYWNAGLKIKAIQPEKQRVGTGGYVRKRLLPVILTGSMQLTPSMQQMEKDEVKGLKLSGDIKKDI